MRPSALAVWRFNTQPPEGGCAHVDQVAALAVVSTHSHPKVAAQAAKDWLNVVAVSTHSHPKVAAHIFQVVVLGYLFQHTATRRWLHFYPTRRSRLKSFQHTATRRWLLGHIVALCNRLWFQHTATRRWLLTYEQKPPPTKMFQHTATRRWLRSSASSNLMMLRFQHTATRRWLRRALGEAVGDGIVSTHSHPKVAAKNARRSER